MKNQRPGLVEVDFTFRTCSDKSDPDYRLFKIRTSLLNGELEVSFDLYGAGEKGPMEHLMPDLLTQIQVGIELARKNVKVEDLVEED